MSRRYIIVDDHRLDEILAYCQQNQIAVFQGRSYSDSRQILAWQLYCEDSHKLSFLLLKYSESLTLV